MSDLLKEPTAEEAAEAEANGTELAEDSPAEKQWAALPQLGFGPETGFLFGAKFTDRNLLSSGLTLDLDGVYAVEGQQFYNVSLASPTIGGYDFPVILNARYRLDPRRRFYGLGNNDQGPDPASSHEIQTFGGDVTIGWRPIEHLALNLEAGGWRTSIRDGDRVDGSPPTPERFPELPGIEGGVIVPFAASVVYDERENLTRPVRGWRVIAKALTVNSDLGSDFDYSSFSLDVGYLHAFFDDRLVLGGRVGAQWIDGAFSKIPFYELAVLGGESTLRGYFPYRFLGTSRVWTNLEARGHLFDFPLFDWWEIGVDGVGFVDVGRVFLDSSDLTSEEPLTPGLEQNDDIRVAYGGGFRFAFSEAIVVRVDAGFSDEETGLVYLTFGHTF